MPTTPPASARIGYGAPPGAVPILPCVDLDRAQAFYAYLGFALLGRTEDYLRVALDSAELHLYLDPGLEPVVNGAGCYLRFADCGALREAWAADGVPCLDVPGSEPYGATCFVVVDPSGNTLRIGALPTALNAAVPAPQPAVPAQPPITSPRER
jgi:catechol 2,3-dioxygenase-like lactoylglutathione lyase family enzyme